MNIANIQSHKKNLENKLEGRLRSIFKPINPDPIFVKNLKKRLSDKAEIYLEKDNFSVSLLLIIFGLLVIVAVSILLGRLFRK
jgi:hypothetical protein